MSMASRREYVNTMSQRYRSAKSRREKSALIDEMVEVLGFHRKHAARVLRKPLSLERPPRTGRKRRKYLEALPVIEVVWEALDYCCAERLHPVLLSTAEQIARHGSVVLTDLVKRQLAEISRATLARRLAEMPSPRARKLAGRQRPGSALRSEVPLGRYDWNEGRPGALELDLVEHNGGSSLGQFAYTLSVVDVVSGWVGHQAVLGRGQTGVHQAVGRILDQWPFTPWGLHTDNGTEFLNAQLVRFARARGLQFTRSRPYCKNDNPHVEQKNLQLVRNVVGYARYDTPADVEWLNQVYAQLDVYVNLFLPSRKLVSKTRSGAKVQKRYDTARTPFQRLCEAGVLDPATQAALQRQIDACNPLAAYRKLQGLINAGPQAALSAPTPRRKEVAD